MWSRSPKPVQSCRDSPKEPRRRKARKESNVAEDGLTRVWRIGRSMSIQGELAADVDVSIEGEFVGKITLQDRELFTGARSRVTADLFAKTVLVRGEVVGNITAQDHVTITGTASVRGDIDAPRVTLAPSCEFSGKIIKRPRV